MASEADEERKIHELWDNLSSEAQSIAAEVLKIERNNLHFVKPEGIVDEIVKAVEARVK